MLKLSRKVTNIMIILFAIFSILVSFLVANRDEFLAIDACKDKGGEWNFDESKCSVE